MFHIASAKYSSIAWGASAGLDLISNVHKLAKKKIIKKAPQIQHHTRLSLEMPSKV